MPQSTRRSRQLKIEILEDRITPQISPSNSSVSFASSADASGTVNTATIVVEDTNGDAVSGLGNSDFNFNLAGGTSTGSFGTITETSTPGTYTANFTGSIAGTTDTLTLVIDSVQLDDQPTVQVTPGSVDPGNSTVSFASSTDASGTPDTATIVVEDAADNAITGLTTSDFSFNLSGASTGSFGSVTATATPGTYTANFIGNVAGSASTLSLQIDSIQLTSQPQVTVTPGSVDPGNSTVSFASSTDVSGTPDTATIVVEDAAGNAIAGLTTGDFSFSLSGASTGSFGSVTATATPGTYTADFTGILAGSASTLTLQIDSVQLTSQPTIQVTPGSVDAGNSTVSFASSADVLNTPDTATIVVEDAAGNAITGLTTSDFSFNIAGGTSTGSFDSVTETATPGTYTVDFTGDTAGSASTLTLQIDSVQLANQPQVTVISNPVDPGNSTVSFASSTDASGTADTATIVVEDASANAISGLISSAFSFSLSGGTSTGSFGTVTETSTPGTYTADFTGILAGSASTLTLQIDSVQLTSQPQVTVTPGSVDAGNSTVSFASSTDASGTADTATIVVEDAAGNAITGLTTSDFSFSLSGGTSTGSFGMVTETSTPGTYTADFTGILAGSASTLTLQIDSVQLTSQPQVTVTPGSVDAGNSTVSFASSTDASGTPDTATIAVEDAAGNAITGLTTSDFSFSLSGASTGSFGTVTESSTPGTYTTDFTGDTAGTSSTLTLVIDSVQLASQSQVTVTPGSVDPGNSTVSFASSTDVSGTPDTATIVVEDAAGNAIAGLTTGDFSFSLSGASTGSFGSVTATATPGTYTTDFTGILAGSASTLTLQIDSIQLTSQPTIQVTPSSVDAGNSTVNFASSTDASGTPDTVTIVVEDAAGNAITGLTTGNFSFSLSGASTGSFGTVTETATPGTYTANFTGILAGSASALTLAIDSVQLASQPQVTVTPGSVDPGNSSVAFASSTDVSGTPDAATIVVEDAAGNAITGLTTSDFSFSLSGASTGSFGTVTETATPGTYTTDFTGILAGSASALTLQIDRIQLTSQPTVQVTPGSLDAGESTVSFAISADVLGTTDTVTIVVEDAAGNAITGLTTSDFSFSLSGGTSTGSFGAVTETSTPGTYTANFTGDSAGSASTLTLQIDSVQLTSQPQVIVISSPVDPGNSTVSFASSTDPSGTPDTVTIVVEDAGGDAISGLLSSAFNFSLSGGTSTGSFGSVTETATPGTYTADFTGILAGSASTLTLQIAGVQLDDQPTIQVTPGSVDPGNSTVNFTSASDVSGTPDTVTIVVEDAAGNTISGLTASDFSFNLAGGTSTGSFGTVTETATPGTYTANFTGILAGSAATLTLQVSGVQLTSQPQVTVSAGPVDPNNSTVSFASSTDASGTPDIVTIVVEDAVGNAISGLVNSDFSFSLSGGTSTGSFGTVTETATPGTYTADFTGNVAGSASTLTLQIDSVQLTSQPQVTVTPGSVDPNNSTVSFASPADVLSTPDTVTIVVEDAVGNAISGLTTSDFSFNFAGGASMGSFANVTETSTPGTYTADFTGNVAGSASTLTLQIDNVQLTSQPQVTVTPGSVDPGNSTVNFASSTDASGTPDTVTIVVEDAEGNAISGLISSAFNFNLSGGTSTGLFGAVTETSTPGTYTASFIGTLAGSDSTLTLQVAGVQLNDQPTVQVTPGSVNAGNSTVSFASSTDASGTPDTATIVVEDSAGNAVTGLTTSDFSFSLSGASTGSFGSVTETATPGTYTANFTGILAGSASTLTLQIDSVQLTSQPQVTVTPGSVDPGNSTVSFASSTDASGTPDTVTIVVEDAAGNAISGLTTNDFVFSLSGGTSTGSFGTVTETSTPGTYTTNFASILAGSAATLTLQVSGVQLTSQPQVTVTPGAVGAGQTTVSFTSPTVTSGNSDIVTIVVKDAAGNAISGLTNNDFSFSLAGTSTGSFGSVTETATPGTYTANFTGIVAGAASPLMTNIDGIQIDETPTVQVNVAGPSNAFVSIANGPGGFVTLVTRSDGTLTQYDSTGAHLLGTGILNASIAFGPSGAVVLVTRTDGSLYEYSSAGAQLLGGGVLSASIAFGPSGAVVLVTRTDGSLYEYSSAGAQLLGGGVLSASIAFGPSGAVIQVTRTDLSLTQYDSTGAHLLGSGVLSASIAFAPTTVVDVIYSDGTLYEFDASGSHYLGQVS